MGIVFICLKARSDSKLVGAIPQWERANPVDGSIITCLEVIGDWAPIRRSSARREARMRDHVLAVSVPAVSGNRSMTSSYGSGDMRMTRLSAINVRPCALPCHQSLSEGALRYGRHIACFLGRDPRSSASCLPQQHNTVVVAGVLGSTDLGSTVMCTSSCAPQSQHSSAGRCLRYHIACTWRGEIRDHVPAVGTSRAMPNDGMCGHNRSSGIGLHRHGRSTARKSLSEGRLRSRCHIACIPRRDPRSCASRFSHQHKGFCRSIGLQRRDKKTLDGAHDAADGRVPSHAALAIPASRAASRAELTNAPVKYRLHLAPMRSQCYWRSFLCM